MGIPKKQKPKKIKLQKRPFESNNAYKNRVNDAQRAENKRVSDFNADVDKQRQAATTNTSKSRPLLDTETGKHTRGLPDRKGDRGEQYTSTKKTKRFGLGGKHSTGHHD